MNQYFGSPSNRSPEHTGKAVGRRHFLAASSTLAVCAASGLPAFAADESPKATEGLADKLRGSAVIVVGKIVNRKDGPTGLSFPPLFNLTFQIGESEKLRGKWFDEATAAYSVRQQAQPNFDTVKKYVVGLRAPAGGKGNWQVAAIELADEGNLARFDFPLRSDAQGDRWGGLLVAFMHIPVHGIEEPREVERSENCQREGMRLVGEHGHCRAARLQ